MSEKENKKVVTENYSFKEMNKDFEGFEALQSIYEFAKQFGYANKKLDDAFKKMESENKKYQNMKDVLYKFNSLFADKGWIAYESLSLKLMEKCVGLAEEGEPKEAENELIKYYHDRKEINHLVKRLIHFKEFQPRKALFLKALDDHFHSRYHSSVTIFLMMIDGFVNDIEKSGFFTEKTDMTVWDTIVAHDSTLGKLHRVLNKTRKKTTDDKINMPYRNGILHGRDLGYDNSQVSSKSLAILLALRDWADAIRQGKREKEREYVTPSLEESVKIIMQGLDKHKENTQQIDYMDNVWKPREIILGEDLPIKGDFGDYEQDTPEKIIVEFLSLLAVNNYGKLAKYVTTLSNREVSIGELAGQLREIFLRKKLVDYKLIEINDNAPAITEVKTILEIDCENGKHISDNRIFRLIYQDKQGKPLIRGYHHGDWKVLFNFHDLEYKDYL